jgi:5-dehydro-2-deoxygluconokinase
MGRVGVDLYPLQVGVPLEAVDTFGKFLGGSAANVAVAAARLGRRAALIGKVGTDPFGRFVRGDLERLGVSTEFVGTSPRPTPLTFCERYPPNRFPLFFYGGSASPALTLSADELPRAAIGAARVFWVTLTGLSYEPSRTAHLEALRERHRTPWTVLDLDFRPDFWPGGEAQARELARAAIRGCTVVVGNGDECRVATGETDPRTAAARLLDLGVQLVVVKTGPDGVIALTRAGTWAVPGYRVEVVNGLGAGDAFGGALCHGLLGGWSLERTLRFANAAGAYVTTFVECADAMPTPADVTAFMARWV